MYIAPGCSVLHSEPWLPPPTESELKWADFSRAACLASAQQPGSKRTNADPIYRSLSCNNLFAVSIKLLRRAVYFYLLCCLCSDWKYVLSQNTLEEYLLLVHQPDAGLTRSITGPGGKKRETISLPRARAGTFTCPTDTEASWSWSQKRETKWM